jgi:hypothetical protein
MTHDQRDDASEAFEEPDWEVWNHLWTGIDTAHDDIAEKLPPKLLKLYEDVAGIVFGAQQRLVLDKDDHWLAGELRKRFPSKEAVDPGALLELLVAVVADGGNPWLKHAVELEAAREGVNRASGALKRLVLLTPHIAEKAVPSGAEPYLQEVANTFLFGFDAACIALCRASFEALGRSVLLSRHDYGEARLKKEKLTADGLFRALLAHGELGQTRRQVEKLIDRGNTVMHKHAYDSKVRQQLALESIDELLAIARDLLGGTRAA